MDGQGGPQRPGRPERRVPAGREGRPRDDARGGDAVSGEKSRPAATRLPGNVWRPRTSTRRQGSLRTKQLVGLDNSVSTTICLPDVRPERRRRRQAAASGSRRRSPRSLANAASVLGRRRSASPPSASAATADGTTPVRVHACGPDEGRLPHLQRRARAAEEHDDHDGSRARRSHDGVALLSAECRGAEDDERLRHQDQRPPKGNRTSSGSSRPSRPATASGAGSRPQLNREPVPDVSRAPASPRERPIRRRQACPAAAARSGGARRHP